MEASYQWRNAAGRIYSAGQKTSLMRELTAWVIDHTIAQLSDWRDQGFLFPSQLISPPVIFLDPISLRSLNRNCGGVS
jgi:EAL domain-containing protein (putative c-di-GMP-specific phosphodiesterase class I)